MTFSAVPDVKREIAQHIAATDLNNLIDLLWQEFIKDPTKTVKEVLLEAEMEISTFRRFQVGQELAYFDLR